MRVKVSLNRTTAQRMAIEMSGIFISYASAESRLTREEFVAMTKRSVDISQMVFISSGAMIPAETPVDLMTRLISC